MRALLIVACGLATIASACGGGAKPADTAADSKAAAATPAGPMSEEEVETACAEIAKNDAQCSTQSGTEEKAKGQCTRGVVCMRDFMRPEAIRPLMDCSRASACDHDKCLGEVESKITASPALTAFLTKCEGQCGGKLECKKVGKRILSDAAWPPATKCFEENADCEAAAVCAGMQILGVAGKGMTCLEHAAREPGASTAASPTTEPAPETTTTTTTTTPVFPTPKKGAKPTPKPTRKK